jgi:hypothetical protein
MYQFKIKKQEEGGYRFELDNIKMLVDDYSIRDGKHLLSHPNKAIGYFNFGGNVNGIGNIPEDFDTAEAFYDVIKKQYRIFTGGKVLENTTD